MSCRLVAHRCEPAVRRKPAAEDSLHSQKPPSAAEQRFFARCVRILAGRAGRWWPRQLQFPSLRRGSWNRLFRKVRGSGILPRRKHLARPVARDSRRWRLRQNLLLCIVRGEILPIAINRWECPFLEEKYRSRLFSQRARPNG